MTLPTGTKLGPYEIVAPIGEGGMGEVYRGRDSRLERDVAIKVLPERLASEPRMLDRFEREAKAVAALAHPNILAIYDVGSVGNVHFAVTELLEGKTLRDRLDSTPISAREAVRLALPIARGLAAAHDRGIIHRDLKPENVFVTADGHVKILDFGLAKIRQPAEAQNEETATHHTTPGTILGTMGYMSPEQVRGQKTDQRSDLFSFGVILHEMLSGRKTFPGESAADVMSAILRENPAPLSNDDLPIPPVLERIALRCLEKRTADRFQSARDLAFALEAIPQLDSQPGSLPSGPVAPTSEPSMPGAPPSIAVLPFTDMSHGKDQEYFCDGMADEIINALTRIKGLRVASRSSAFRFRDSSEDIRRVGEAMNVRTVLEGSVRTAGNRLRVTTQLIDVENGYHVWSERYDRQMEDVFDIQDEISENIVAALRVKLVGDDQAAVATRNTSNLEAYHLYLKGLHNWYRRDRDSISQAARFFDEAARLDPTYVLAHTGLTIAYSSLGYYGMRQSVAYPKAKAAIERARELDDGLAEVHAALGLMRLWLELDWERAETSFLRALEIDPDAVLPRCWYGFMLDWTRRSDEGLAMAERARELDPLSSYVNTSVGLSQFQRGRHDEAVAAVTRALEMEPDSQYSLWVLGGAHSCSGRHDEGIRVFERAVSLSGRAPFHLAWLAWAQGIAGRKEPARAILDELHERSRSEYVAETFFAWVYVGLGDTDEAFVWLGKACDARCPQLALIASLPLYDRVRTDPRFDELLKRLQAGPRETESE